VLFTLLIDVVSFYAREEEYRKTHPEWFEDEELALKLTTDLLKRQATNMLWFFAAGLVGSFFGSLIW